ncbi:MAG TPA: TonB-dependent receptor [Bacteroidota bacterium]|nr:TonB-dependent receptor [Bacteroidota bacterium]
MKSGILISLVLSVSCSAFSQDFCTVRGTVRDGATHEPLVFANISVAGTRLGTATDARGTFSIELPRGKTVLRCSYVGYKTAEIPISVDNEIRVLINLDAMDILLQDVTVYAYQGVEREHMSASLLSLQSEEIKNSTAVIPDVLRSTHMLPGVSANNEFSAKFNVRGGNQDENLILVNGTQMYDPYHVKEVPNASISIMMMDMIRKMDLMTGGFPARYGDKMSAVVDIQYREGDRDRYKGTATASLTDADIVAEGPLGEDASFIFGVRKSYFEYLLKYINRGSYHHPSFYDAQGVVDYSLSSGHTLFFKFLHAGDSYTQDPLTHRYVANSPTTAQRSGDSLNNRGQYYSTLLSLQSVNIMSSSAIVKTELSLHDQRENERFWDNEYSDIRDSIGGQSLFDSSYTLHLYGNDLRIWAMALNSMFDYQVSSLYGIKIGLSYEHITYAQDQLFQYTFDRYTNSVQYPDTTISHDIENILDIGFNNLLNTQSWKSAGYVESLLQLSDHLLLNMGGRFDYFDLNKAPTWSPRIQLAYQVREGLTLRGAWGFFYQSPNYRQIAHPAASDTNTRSQKAIHYVFGVDYQANVGPDYQNFLRVKVEGFYKDYDNLMSAYLTSSGIVYYSRKNDALGSAKGVDVYVMYSASGFYGWVSYGYLSSTQDVRDDGYGSFPRNTDQRHTLAAVGNLDLGTLWNVSARFVYGSGYPFTPSTAAYDSAKVTWQWIRGTSNSGRIPPYIRTDLRISKGFEMFGLATSAFLDISNVFNTMNIQSFRYTRDGNGNPLKQEIELWPIIPSVGLSVRF